MALQTGDLQSLPLPSVRPKEFSVPLPLSPQTTLHVHLTSLETSLLVFLTTTDPSTLSSLRSLGSFVYAMPDRTRSSEAISTTLYSNSSSIDFATRIAKILAGNIGKPTYVGSSVVFGVATVEEEVAGMKAAVKCVMEELEACMAVTQVNGT